MQARPCRCPGHNYIWRKYEMNLRSGMIFGLAAALTLGGCAAGAAGGGGPLTSPTGKVYEPGIEPTQTPEARTATLAVATGDYETALAEAQAGIAADSTNPIHYFLAGQAAAGLEQYELADEMWREAERLFPAYELEIEPSREQVWADAFNMGVETYNAGDTEAALRAWRGAHLIYRLRPEAAQNLAVLLTQENEYDEAIEVYQQAIADLELEPATRVIEEPEITERATARSDMLEALAQLLLFTDQFAEAEAILRQQLEVNPDDIDVQANLANALARQGNEAEAAEIYARLLNNPDLDATQMFNVGVSLFNAQDFPRAAQAFERVLEVQPNSRDAWNNLASALYSAESWDELAPISAELVEADPLNENTGLMIARAYRELEQNNQALEALQRIEDLPIYLEGLSLTPAGERASVSGQVVGNAAAAGTPVQLRFTFYNDGAQVGTETVTVNAPAPEQSREFSVSIQQAANAYSYELAQ